MIVTVKSKTKRHGSDTTKNTGYVLYYCITIMINLIVVLLLSTPTAIVSASIATTTTTTTTPADMITTNLMYGTSSICLQQLVQCSTDVECQLCYNKLAENEIDWSIAVTEAGTAAAAAAATNTNANSSTIFCDSFLSLLHKYHYCLSIPESTSVSTTVPSNSKDYFCNVLLSCSNDVNNNNNNNIHKELIPTTSTSPIYIPNALTSTEMDTSFIDYNNITIVNDWIPIDCNELTECYWPGMQQRLLGNGKCNDITLYNDHTYGGCYNTKICNYDNGDCCPDTCNVSAIDAKLYSYKYECGTIGDYLCRNPRSIACLDSIDDEHVQCLDGTEDVFVLKTYQDVIETWGGVDSYVCEETTIEYIVRMKDSFGDGWDTDTTLLIRKRDNNTAVNITAVQTINSILQEQDMNSDPSFVFDGNLAMGHDAYVQVCIPKTSDTYCYTVELRHTTIWGRYISWEIYPPAPTYVRNGTSSSSLKDILPPPIAHGSGLSLPKVCQFSILNTDTANDSIVQQDCPNTCTGNTAVSTDQSGVVTTLPNNDDNENVIDEIQLKDMYKCMDKKCFIQVNECNKNSNCTKCFQSTIPTVDCYMIDTFMLLSDCTMCKCMPLDASTLQFCSTKVSTSTSTSTTNSSTTTSSSAISTIPNTVCTSSMLQAGSVAIMTYTQQCIASISTMDILLRYYDEHHFGLLDTFRSCVDTYVHNSGDSEDDIVFTYRSVSPLACVQILYNAITPHNNFIHTTDRDDILVSKQYPIIISEIAKHVWYEIDDTHSSSSTEQTTTTDSTERVNNFCTCTDIIHESMPVCPTFINFNKLLIISSEVCEAMHQVECGAYREFAYPCISHLQKKSNYNNNFLDFSNSNYNDLNEQCTYIEESCGGSGFFPLNRSLYNCEYQFHNTDLSYLYTNYTTYCRHRNDKNKNSNNNNNNNNNVRSNNNIHTELGGQQQEDAIFTNQMKLNEVRPIYIPHEELGQNNGTKGGRIQFLFICVIITVISLAVVYKRRQYFHNTNIFGSYRTVVEYDEDIRYNDTDTSRDWYLLQNRTTSSSSIMLNGNDDENGIALSTSIATTTTTTTTR